MRVWRKSGISGQKLKWPSVFGNAVAGDVVPEDVGRLLDPGDDDDGVRGAQRRQRARVAGDHVVVGRDDHVDAGGEKADHPIVIGDRRVEAGAAVDVEVARDDARRQELRGERLDLQRDRQRHPRREIDVGAIDAGERAAGRIDVVLPGRDGQVDAAVDDERAVASGRAAVRRAEHGGAAGKQAVEAGDRRACGRRIVEGDQHQLGVGDGDAGRRFDGDLQIGRRRDRHVADRQVGRPPRRTRRRRRPADRRRRAGPGSCGWAAGRPGTCRRWPGRPHSTG